VLLSRILNPNQNIQVATIVPRPFLVDFKTLTNQSFINLEGRSQANTKVVLFVNDNYLTEVLSSEDGKFLFTEVGIVKGKNRLKLQSETLEGKKSDFSEIYELDFDDTKPEIKSINIKNGQEIRNLNQNIKVIGEVSESSDIEINGRRVVNINGNKFEYLLGLKEGDFKIEVKVIDKAGNELEEVYYVKYTKE
jgi:hypothetical protein